MFSNIFGKKEPDLLFRVEVTRKFYDTHAGMAGDDYVREVPVGETGTAKITAKGKCTITLDNVKDVPYDRKLVIYCTQGDSVYSNFRFTPSK